MLNNILNYAVKNNCSDIHFASGQYPILRINGDITRLQNAAILKNEDIIKIIKSLLSEKKFADFEKGLEIDFAFEIKNCARFRANAFKTNNGAAIAIRPINENIKTLDEIYAPKTIKDLLQRRRGLIVVSGPTGCGKSTTMAAMIDHINKNFACNIITIEDPIEYIHKPKKSLILQREIGVHTNSCASALKSCLRENPDVILIGEMRDKESFALALTAAETGHLVLATLHTSSCANAINRIIDMFSQNEQITIRSSLSNSLNGVIVQRLVKTNQNNRRGVFEVMIGNNSIRNLIREDKIAQMNSMIEIGKKFGMITMKDSILELLSQGLISEEEANLHINSFASL